ncbi:hypothetical protein SAMN02745202_00701 [Segatella oulorum]|uniref:Uncharacterized protein n=1 Tax=Segatella oulorum TaxID=28136 RepID=A0A1T4MCZ3_9BACT|nr:hypothetical protein SAMN02745202_00701 [Segatella oulorum]
MRFSAYQTSITPYFVCMGLRGKIWWRWVGAVPVCPPVSPCWGAFIVKFPAHNAYIFWHGNTATRTFGRARRHRPYAFCLRELCMDVRPYGFVWQIVRVYRPYIFRLGRLHVDVEWYFCLMNE